jgi:hypothetical protein
MAGLPLVSAVQTARSKKPDLDKSESQSSLRETGRPVLLQAIARHDVISIYDH